MNTVMIVAAGSGKRMNAGMNKQFIKIDNKEIIAHTIERFYNSSMINEIILCIKKEEEEFVRKNILEKYHFENIIISYGGKERQDTINNGLDKVSPNCDILLIHDGARPFITDEIIENAINETKKLKATVVGVMVKDTIKIVDGNEIKDTPNRANLWAAQTPQSFEFNLIKDAYKKAYEDGFYGTDDAMIVERAGHKVYMIDGSYNNIKITSPEDLAIAEIISRKIKE
nr:2-C-methyl-D-erythritol 4-phosphate cytidylyltransferase [Peptacetobacter sp.]